MAARCRIGCVRIGRFAIGALHRTPTGDPSARRASNAAPGRQALAAVADLRGKPRVIATSREAERRGVAVGMALAEAKALAADLVALPWDEERVARAALEVTAALLAATPRVSWTGARGARGRTVSRTYGEGVWWMDAAGFGDETKLARKIVAIAAGLGYGSARAGIADSAIAAYAATSRRAIVPPGGDAAYLAPFSVTLLDLDEDFAETLRGLGLTTLGQLAALEADEVEARFGPEGLAAHRLARGFDSRGPSARRDDVLPGVEVELGSPVATAEPLLFVLKGALASLGDALHDRGLAARELTLRLRLDDGSIAERAVRPARPTSHADALFDHCRTALETWQLPEPATDLALRAAVTVPAAGEQGDLLAPRWADPSALTAALDRIRSREGSDAVAVPEARDAHLPEEGGAWAPEPGGSPTPRGRDVPPSRSLQEPAATLRLLPAPEPVHVRLGRSGLAAFRYGGSWHDILEWCGPERLAPRWWERSDAGAPGQAGEPRDYYTAKTAAGTLWLLYRAAARQWVLAGWLD